MISPLLSIRFAAYFGALFLAIGIYLPFWPLWLEARGLDASEIGLVLALASLSRIVSGPLFGQIADRRWGARATSILAAFWSLVGFAAFVVADSFWPIFMVMLIWAFPFGALVPLGESQAMAAVTERGLDYGRMRLWGSLTFILGALGAGELLSGRDPSLIYWMLLAALAATAFCTLALPREAHRSLTALDSRGIAHLLTDRRFVVLLAAAGLLQSSHAVYYGFSAIHWRAAGHSTSIVGWLWAEGVIAEILLFALSAPLLRRLDPIGLLLIAGFAGLLRWALLASSSALFIAAGAQLLHAFTFGAAHLGTVHLIARMAPPGLKTTAQALYAAIAAGVFVTLAMLAAGPLYAAFGGGAYWASLGLSLAGLALAGRLYWTSP